MLTPLIEYICDTCGEVIKSPEEGWIEWISKSGLDGEKRETYGFNIVHHFVYSPLKDSQPNGCYQHTGKSGRHDLHLHDFIKESTIMAHILEFLDVGPYHQPVYKKTDLSDIRQYVETVRRLTIPYYEEARLYWDKAKEDGYFQDANEIWIYKVENLKKLIELYGDE